MAIETNLSKVFIVGINKIMPELKKMDFDLFFFTGIGFGEYIEFRNKKNTSIEFFFGPSDWDIEIIIQTSKGKFGFRDLMEIKETKIWILDNIYKKVHPRSIESELFWFLDLLRNSLKFIE